MPRSARSRWHSSRLSAAVTGLHTGDVALARPTRGLRPAGEAGRATSEAPRNQDIGSRLRAGGLALRRGGEASNIVLHRIGARGARPAR